MFEDTKQGVDDIEASDRAIKEWMDAVEQAKGIATAQAANNQTYSTDDALNMSTSALSAASSISQTGDLNQGASTHGHSGRATLQKSQGDNESLKGRKRFSKRQSKSGLTAVF